MAFKFCIFMRELWICVEKITLQVHNFGREMELITEQKPKKQEPKAGGALDGQSG